jgi:diguanylate cyclase (GGDEF)-like protein
MNRIIKNWIIPEPAMVEEEESLVAAVQKMAEKRIGAILITNNGALQGIFTERDLLHLFSSNTEEAFRKYLDQPISNFMTSSPIYAKSTDEYNDVYNKMKAHNVRHIPILDNNKVVGIVSMRDLLRFYQNQLEAAFNEARQENENLKKLVAVSDEHRIAVLLKEIQKYKELSLTDHLTGLFNKRYFQSRLVEEVTRARRANFDLSLIFCDIDFFKRINDRFGHHRGDEVLRTTAQLLSGAIDELDIISRLRKSDIIARYGGEEFVIILPETGRQGATAAAERLRKVIEEYTYLLDGENVRITMSFGVAGLTANNGDHTEIIKNADMAMYKAKNNGRNQVVVYPA